MIAYENWNTIKTINLPPNQKVRRLTKWIDINNTFPEYRIIIESSHLNQHVDKKNFEISNKSGKKAMCFELINYYDMEIEALLQEKV